MACKKNQIKDNSLDQKKDSLFFFFEAANSDSLSYEQRQLYSKKAVVLISKQKNDSLNRVNYFKIANRYFNMNAMDDYKSTTLLIIQNSEKAEDTLSLAKAYSYLGDYYGNKFISDSAYLFYFKAEKLYLKLKDDSKVAQINLNKAVLQFNEKDYIGSEKSAFKCLTFLRKTNNDELFYEAYNILGIIYNDLNEFNKSLEFHNKALMIVKKGNLPTAYQSKATSLNNIGALFQKKKNYKGSISYFKTALDEPNLINDKPFLYAALKNNLGYSKFKLNQFEELPKLFYESLAIRDSLKIIPGIISNKINLSEYYAFQKDSMKAKSLANEAYELAKRNNLASEVLVSLKQLSSIEPQKAAKYSEEYLEINDSLQLAERQIRNKLARIEYETEELVLEKDKLVEQRKTLIYIGLGIIVLGVFIYVIRSQAARNRELQLLQEQQQANEEIYQLMLNQQNKIEEVRQLEKKRIAQDLHDGILGKLFGTRLNLGTLNNQINNEAIESRKTYIEELKVIEQEIREISHDLNSEKTAIFNNFVLMVSNFIENQASVCKAEIHFTMDPLIDWNGIDNMAKINFYRILQEAFQNINKYAEAKHVFVTFAKLNSSVELRIEDDGLGFNYLKKKKGIGLSNMNTRINSSGGTMNVVSEIGKGALLTFELPV